MKERPMIFQEWGVRAIMAGLKTQTRRIVKPQPDSLVKYHCPYPKGSRLWAREAFEVDDNDVVRYRADCPKCEEYLGRSLLPWKPSIFMPREHSRIDLIATKDRDPERVQDISEEDSIAEGAQFVDFGNNKYGQQLPGWRHDYIPVRWEDSYSSARWSFAGIWNCSNAKPKPKKRKGVITHYESYPWSENGRDPRGTINGKPHYCYPNPWVWPVEFEMEEKQ